MSPIDQKLSDEAMRMMRSSENPAIFFHSVERLVVVVIDGDEQPILRQSEMLGDEGPGELDRVGLEVIAEREIAQHLEERVVACGVADVVEIVVLAPCAHAFLRCRRADW